MPVRGLQRLKASLWSFFVMFMDSLAQDLLESSETWPFVIYIRPIDPRDKKIMDMDDVYLLCQFASFDARRSTVEICDYNDFKAPKIQLFDRRSQKCVTRTLPVTSIFWKWGTIDYRGSLWPVLEPFFFYKLKLYVSVPVPEYLKGGDSSKTNRQTAVQMTNKIEDAGLFLGMPPYPSSSETEADRLLSLQLWFEMDTDVINPQIGTPSFRMKDYPEQDFFGSLIAEREFRELEGTADPSQIFDDRALEESSFFTSLCDQTETEVEREFRMYGGMSCQGVSFIRGYLPWNATGMDIKGDMESTDLYKYRKYEPSMRQRLEEGSVPPIGERGEMVVGPNTMARLKNIPRKRDETSLDA
ncbi:hypothetical protein TWF102_000118 [Orbilia oligospora]|uniref:Uncharacterized protein n=1 Tax=Orbilia oligospora TaxID=2813651 RepID=A0A7C8NWY3_ORBOL|nr:hypothetical protein TWF102_000118 [Orbilia oligospora]